MATNKNNRKKGKKRQQMHKRPVPQHVAEARKQIEEEEVKELKRSQTVSMVGVLCMVIGFAAAMLTDITIVKLIGLPISFVGSILCLFTIRPDVKHKTIAIVGYIIYCVLIAYLFIGIATGKAM